MSRWIIKFRRSMRTANPRDERVFGRLVIGWVPLGEKLAHVVRLRYWDARYKMWASSRHSAYEYKTLERAERMAFKLVSKDPSLIGEVEVVEIPAMERYSTEIKL